ncbi:MAG: Bcr/CflA family efflux MFS transporter [Burkholderiaceae bacterium]
MTSDPGTAQASDHRQGKSKLVQANLISQIALGIIAMTACLPSMPFWIEHFGESQARVQLTFAAYALAFAFGQLVYGPLSDRFGRRRLLIVGLLVGLAGSVSAVFAQSLDAIIAARALQGAGTCAGIVIGRAIIQDNFVGAARTKMMALVGIVMGLCPPSGTLIGGQLHVSFGWQAPFVAVALLSCLLLLSALLMLPPDKPSAANKQSAGELLKSYRSLIADIRYLSFCLIAAFSTATFYVFLAAAPIVFDAYGVAPNVIGWYIMFVPAAYIMGNLLTSRIAGKFADQRLMTIGQGFNVVGILLVLGFAMSGWYHPLAVAMPLMCLGFGHGLLMPPTLVGAVGAMPALAGAAAAFAGMLQQLTGAGASSLNGLLDLTDATDMAWLMLLLTLIAVAAQLMPAALRRPETK